MGSKIEHHAKWGAYMSCYMWGKSDSMDKASLTWYDKQKYESHTEHCESMKKSGKYWIGTPPRSKFLNWLAHKLLELAWGKNIYL